MFKNTGIKDVNLNVPLSDALLTIDTRDGMIAKDGFYTNQQNPYNIQIYKNQQLFSGAVERLSLTEINMPWVSSNVNTRNNALFMDFRYKTVVVDNTNNTFIIDSNIPEQDPIDVVVANGTYTILQYVGLLASGIEQNLQALPGFSALTCAGTLTEDLKIQLVFTGVSGLQASINQQSAATALLTGWTGTIPIFIETNPTLVFDAPIGYGYTIRNVGFKVVSGFYTTDELATAVQTAIQTYSFPGETTNPFSTFTVSWDSKNNRFILTSSASPLLKTNYEYRINPMNGKDKGIETDTTDGIRRSSTLAEMMGFSFVSDKFTSWKIFSGWASMLQTNYIDITSSTLCKNQKVRDTSTAYVNGHNVLARIYLTPERFLPVNSSGTNMVGTRPFMIYKSFPIPKEIQWNREEFLSSVDIQIRDDKGDILYVDAETPFSVEEESIEVGGNTAWVQLTFQVSEAAI